VAAGELGDAQRAAAGIDEELAVEGRGADEVGGATEPVGAVGEGVLPPPAGVVDEHGHRTEVALDGVEHARRGRGIGEVGLDAQRTDVGVALAIAVVLRRATGVALGRVAQVGDGDDEPVALEGRRGGRPDAVVAAGDERDARRVRQP
jgi:hypothetical protein